MHGIKVLPMLIGLGTAQIVPFDYTLPVLFSPVNQVKAGQELHYQLANSRNSTCQATMKFSNDKFLSISTIAKPKNCAGDQTAILRIPNSVPDGVAGLEWQCSGTDGTTVDLMVISGGLNNPEELAADNGSAYLTVHCRTNATRTDSKPTTTPCH